MNERGRLGAGLLAAAPAAVALVAVAWQRGSEPPWWLGYVSVVAGALLALGGAWAARSLTGRALITVSSLALVGLAAPALVGSPAQGLVVALGLVALLVAVWQRPALRARPPGVAAAEPVVGRDRRRLR